MEWKSNLKNYGDSDSIEANTELNYETKQEPNEEDEMGGSLSCVDKEEEPYSIADVAEYMLVEKKLYQQ